MIWGNYIAKEITELVCKKACDDSGPRWTLHPIKWHKPKLDYKTDVPTSTSEKTMAENGQKKTCQWMEQEATENSGQERFTQDGETC